MQALAERYWLQIKKTFMGKRNTQEVEDVEEVETVADEVSEEATEETPEVVETEDRSAYNCTNCEGRGLVENDTKLCPQCVGTGKV